MFVWNKTHSCKPLNLYQSNGAAASKQALLIYDTGGLVLRQWITALLCFIFIKRLLSLIMRHMHSRLAGCTDRVALGSLCVCVCVWQPSTFEDHPEIWCIPQGSKQKGVQNLHGKNKNMEQEGTYSPVLPASVCVCVVAILSEKSFSTFKVCATGNLNKRRALQYLPTGGGRRKNTDLKFSACTWLCNILQLFSCSPHKTAPHHLSQRRTHITVLYEASVELLQMHLSK